METIVMRYPIRKIRVKYTKVMMVQFKILEDR